MIRRPPRSTLFPTRRSSDLSCNPGTAAPGRTRSSSVPTALWRPASPCTRLTRSEEHTSELQSHLNLVCRLLLEKKTKVEQRGNHFMPRSAQPRPRESAHQRV